MGEKYLSKNSKQLISLLGAIAIVANQVVGGGVISLTGIAIGMTGGGTPIAYTLASLSTIIVSLPYIVIATAIPTSGGSYVWPSIIFGPRIGFLSVWLQIPSMFSLSLYGISAGMYLDAINISLDPRLTAFVIITIFFIVNLAGVSFSSRVNIILSIVMFCGFAAFIIYGLYESKSHAFPEILPKGLSGLMNATALLSFATIGGYGVAELSSNIRNPRKSIPLAMIGGTTVVAILYTLIAIPAVAVLPVETAQDKSLLVVAEVILPRAVWFFFIIGGALTALVSTLNSQLLWGTKGMTAAIEDGWFRNQLNNRLLNKSHFVLTFVYLVGLIPLLLDFDISTIARMSAALIQLMLLMVNITSIAARYHHSTRIQENQSLLSIRAHWILSIVSSIILIYQFYFLIADFTMKIWFVIVAWILLGIVIVLSRGSHKT